jgi:hypothetical protein
VLCRLVSQIPASSTSAQIAATFPRSPVRSEPRSMHRTAAAQPGCSRQASESLPRAPHHRGRASNAPSTLVIGALTPTESWARRRKVEAALSADYVTAVKVMTPAARPVDLIRSCRGHEFRALSGAGRTIERYHPRFLPNSPLPAWRPIRGFSDALPRAKANPTISVIGAPEVDTIEGSHGPRALMLRLVLRQPVPSNVSRIA